MEVTLNKDDIEAIANIVTKKIRDEIIAASVSQEAFNLVAEKARGFATVHMNSDTFAFEAKEMFREVLEKSGGKLIREMTSAALRDVMRDETALVEVAKKIIAKSVVEEADRLSAQFGQ